MLGYRSAFTLVLAAALCTGCRKTPTATRENAISPPVVMVSYTPQKSGGSLSLSRAVTAYEAEPTGERAAEVWTAFAHVDAKLSELRRQVTHRAGGARAEAEIERIELQRVRDEQMARFAKAHARMENAIAALNALSESEDSGDGVRAAASVVARGLGTENRDWMRGLRGLQSRLEIP